MLRITVSHDDSSVRIDLEGRLVGEWVTELRSAWSNLPSPATPQRPVRVSLKGLTCVDRDGRALLEQMYRSGVEIRAAGLKMSGLMEEIQSCCETGVADSLMNLHHPESKTPGPA